MKQMKAAQKKTQLSNTKSRRHFLASMTKLGALMAMSPFEMARGLGFHRIATRSEGFAINRLSWRAQRSTDFEGAWQPSQVEGSLPSRLNGILFRVGPGSKVTQGVPLKHYFDGDAYLNAIQFSGGHVTGRARFIETIERQEERSAKKMLYHDFGTAAPESAKGFKNSPSVNVLEWHGRFLALSEATAPTEFLPESLATKGLWQFEGSLKSDVSFTAHPRIDPKNGDLYTYGITRGISPKLVVMKANANSATLSEIVRISLGGYYPIHDMMMTENYLIFAIPPISVDLFGAALLRKPIAELLKFDHQSPIRFLFVRKDGKDSAVEIHRSVAGVVFHHCNAYEENGQVVLDTILSDGFAAYDLLKSWGDETLASGPISWLTRFKFDLKTKKIVSEERISDGRPCDFPAIDRRAMTKPGANYVHLEVSAQAADGLAFDSLVSRDMNQKQMIARVFADHEQTFGEPVYVAAPGSDRSEEGWILHLGYDGRRDETFLDVRQARELNLLARVWMGHFFPLGFHGLFVK